MVRSSVTCGNKQLMSVEQTPEHGLPLLCARPAITTAVEQPARRCLAAKLGWTDFMRNALRHESAAVEPDLSRVARDVPSSTGKQTVERLTRAAPTEPPGRVAVPGT
jgi:hypothetical protein